jgi:hypothetical protein
MRRYDPAQLTIPPPPTRDPSRDFKICRYVSVHFSNSRDSMPANRSRESESRDSVAPGRVWTCNLTSHVVESRDLARLQGSIDLLSDELRSGSRITRITRITKFQSLITIAIVKIIKILYIVKYIRREPNV